MNPREELFDVNEDIIKKMEQKIRAMAPQYLDSRLKEAQALLECGENDRDIKTIESFGHRLKGNAASFGFPHLGNLGRNLEDAIREKLMDKIEYIIVQIRDEIIAGKTSEKQLSAVDSSKMSQ